MNSNQRKKFEKYGYVIIKKVIEEKKCEEYISDIWTWLSDLNIGIKRNDKSTHFNNLYNLHGIIKDYSSGHSDFMWKIRTNPKILKIFEDFFGTKDLLVSFDVFCIGKNTKSRHQNWIHTDQSSKNSKFYTIQGLLNLKRALKTDMTFHCYPKSHLIHEEMFKNNKKNIKKDWYRLDNNDIKFIEKKGLKLKRLKLREGDVLLWDSRLFHSNIKASINHDNYYRYVTYFSYCPRNNATESQLKKKRKAFEEARSSSHNAFRTLLNPKWSRWNVHKNSETINIRKDKPLVDKKYLYLAGF